MQASYSTKSSTREWEYTVSRDHMDNLLSVEFSYYYSAKKSTVWFPGNDEAVDDWHNMKRSEFFRKYSR
jgi:hypothetical protein